MDYVFLALGLIAVAYAAFGHRFYSGSLISPTARPASRNIGRVLYGVAGLLFITLSLLHIFGASPLARK